MKVRLYGHKVGVVILTPEVADPIGDRTVAHPCCFDFPSRTKPWMLPGPRHRGLTTMRALFITCSLNWDLRKEHGVCGTLGKAYTNSVPDRQPLHPDGQHILFELLKFNKEVHGGLFCFGFNLFVGVNALCTHKVRGV